MLQQTISFSSTVQVIDRIKGGKKKLQISWYNFTLTSAKPGILTEACIFISTVVHEKVGKRLCPPLHIRQLSPFN